MQQEITDEAHTLDDATKWAYANENGVQVFALYGIGDGTEATVLYATKGEKAAENYREFIKLRERYRNGTDRSAKALNSVLETLRRKQGQSNAGVSSSARGRGRTAGHGGVPSVQGKRDGRGSSGRGAENSGDVKFSLKTDSEGRQLTEAQEATSERANTLQEQGNRGRISETKYSKRRPDLNAAEWNALNRHMQQEITDEAHTLDDATKWAYANENGVQVFALYGIGDGTEATVLYAIKGEKAAENYREFIKLREGYRNGTDRSAKALNSVFEALWRERGQSNAGVSSPAEDEDGQLNMAKFLLSKESVTGEEAVEEARRIAGM